MNNLMVVNRPEGRMISVEARRHSNAYHPQAACARRQRSFACAAAIVIAGTACRGTGDARALPATGMLPASVPTRATPQHIATTSGFNAPEALIYDPGSDFYYVSNVGGPVGIKAGKGFISRVTPDGKIDSLHFIRGGVGGVTLNAPMGSRVRGDTLFVLNVDVLRKFDLRSGKPLGMIDFAPLRPHILNDFDWASDGTIYATDMGMIANPHGQPRPGAAMRILKAAPGQSPTVALASQSLDTPDGIAWDGRHHRFVLTPFGGDTVQSWTPGDAAPKPLVAGTGKFDGVETESDGTIYLTNWNSGAVFQLTGDSLVTLISGLTSPSDVTLDSKRHRLGISEMTPNRVQIWELGVSVADSATAR